MSETYRLVFDGELLAGQHASVVRRRLAEAGFKEQQLERLFCGRAVVLKRAADAATAARYRTLFESAGARLTIEAVSEATASPSTAARGGLELLPVGSDLLRADERGPAPPAAPDVSHLSLAAPGADLLSREPSAVPPAPDVSHLRLLDGD